MVYKLYPQYAFSGHSIVLHQRYGCQDTTCISGNQRMRNLESVHTATGT